MGAIGTVVAAIPLLMAAAQIAVSRPRVILDGDAAVDEMALMRSTHLAQLVGNYSRFGWSHPGPAWFYAMDPVYMGLGAQSWAFYVAVLTFHALVAILIVASVWRRGGLLPALITSGLLLLYLRAVGVEIFQNLWPPFIPILPIVLFIILAAAGAAGSTQAIVGALLAGSFVVQTHVSAAPVVAALLAGMVIFRTATFVLGRGHVQPAPRSRWTVVLSAAGLVVLALMWLPVVIEEVTRTPGNLTKLWWFFTTAHGRHSYHEALAAFGRMLEVYPFGHLPPFEQVDFSTLQPEQMAAIVLFTAATGGLAAGATLLGDRFLQALAVLLCVAAPVTVLSISRIVGPMYPYTYIWTTVYPLLLAVGWGALLVRTHPWKLWQEPAASYIMQATTMALTIAVVATAVGRFEALQQLRSPAVEQADPDTRAALAMLDGALASEPPQPLLLNIASHDRWPLASGMALALAKRGWSVSVGKDWVFMFGEGSRPTGAEDVEVIVADARTAGRVRQEIPDAQPIGNTQDTYLFVRHL